MTQMKRIKLCVWVKQRRVEQFLMTVDLETMETPVQCDSHAKDSEKIATEGSLTDNEDTFTWNLCDIHRKKSSKTSFRKTIKNGNSLNSIAMTTDHQ